MTIQSSQVFISYQRTDGEFARQVRAHLAAVGVRTWMDQYDIPTGAYWPDEIDKGLVASAVVVGVLSPRCDGKPQREERVGLGDRRLSRLARLVPFGLEPAKGLSLLGDRCLLPFVLLDQWTKQRVANDFKLARCRDRIGWRRILRPVLRRIRGTPCPRTSGRRRRHTLEHLHPPLAIDLDGGQCAAPDLVPHGVNGQSEVCRGLADG